MKCEEIFFEKNAIIQFLGNHGRPQTKDYEFAAALILHHFCEKQWNEKCWIGFRIRSKHFNSLPAIGNEGVIGLEEIAKLFHGGVDEDSPVDFVVAKRVNMRKAQGMIFQVKRFGIGRKKKDTDELTVYLNSFPGKYAKTNTNLLVSLDDGVEVDIEKLLTGLNTAEFPFNRIIFMWLSSDEVFLKDVFPLGGMMRFPITNLY